MNRIFVDKSEIVGPRIRIKEVDLMHMKKSLRMRDGDIRALQLFAD